jgi:hypothetical protein
LRGLPADATQTWLGTQLTLNAVAPVFVITKPIASIVSKPMIQLQGLVSEPLSELTYDVSNAAGVFTNQQGYWQPSFYDTNLLTFTTNSFQCYDIPLTNGLNTITLHATDLEGNNATTNFNCTLNYAGATNSPVLNLVWPQNGTAISGSNFTLQAQVDDPTATIAASIVDTNGDTNVVQGLVERDGTVWIQNLPLAAGTNTVTLTATDAAGNASSNSFDVVQSSVSLSIDPISDDQLNQSSVTVYGTVSDATLSVYVNGVQATVNDDGTWEADSVPVSDDGTVSLMAQAGIDEGDIVVSATLDQAQPARVGLMNYSYKLQESGSGVNSSWTIDWSYLSGGNQSLSSSLLGGLWSYTAYPAGDDGYNNAPWQPWGLDEHFSFSWINGLGNSGAETADAHVMIEPSDKVTPGTTTTYIVLAQAWGINSQYLPWPLSEGSPLSPDSVKIQGVTLTPFTDSYGEVWGCGSLTAPAGAKVDVTPTAPGNYFFNVQLAKTKEDWQNDVQTEIDSDSGVKIENYLAGNGFLNNRQNIQAVYAFYQKLFTEQPDEFYWAGLAKLAGAPVYAGLSDAQYLKVGAITSGYLTLDDLGATIASALLESKAGQFQTNLMGMQIAVYSDLAWQYEAYLKGGLDALNEINAAQPGVFDIGPWQEIDDGIQNDDDAEIQDGNLLLLEREQKTTLVPGYSDLGNLFPGTTSVMSILAQNPVVGGPSFATLEPSGNIANTDDRWDWVSRSYTSISNTGIYSLWLQESPTSRMNDVQQSLLYRAQNDFSLVYEYFGLNIY